MYCTSYKIHLIVATAEAEVFYAEELESAHPQTCTQPAHPHTHLCAHERTQNHRVLEMVTSLYVRDRNPRGSAAFFQGVSDDMPVTYNTLHKSDLILISIFFFNFCSIYLFFYYYFINMSFFHIEGDSFAYTAAQDKNWTSLYFTFIKN